MFDDAEAQAHRLANRTGECAIIYIRDNPNHSCTVFVRKETEDQPHDTHVYMAVTPKK